MFYSLTDAAHCAGVQLFDKDHSLLYWSSFEFPFISGLDSRARGSAYQNCREFMGVICTLLILRLVVQAPKGSVLVWTNDNMAALSWIESNRANSAYAQYAFTAFSLLIMHCGYVIADTEHIAGNSARMTVTDGISRRFTSALASLPPSKRVDLDSFPGVVELFLLISPLRLSDAPDAVASTFAAIAAVLRRF